MHRSAALLLVVFAAVLAAVLAGVPALAQDPPKDPPKTPPPRADGKERAAGSEANVGRQFVTVKLVGGSSIRGIVESPGLWERNDPEHGWQVARKGDVGAGLRLCFVDGADGRMFVLATATADVKVDGPCTDADFRRASDLSLAAEAKAADARKRAREAQAAAAAETATREAAKVPVVPLPPAAPTEQRAPDAKASPAPAADPVDAAKRQRWSELLEKYPPTKWTPDTPAAVRKRFIVLGIPATQEERDFEAVLVEWKEAFEDWKKSLAKKSPATK